MRCFALLILAALASRVAPVSAQTTLFTDDFSTSLADWTVGDGACDTQPSGWSVTGQLIYAQSSCGDCSVVVAGDPGWSNYSFSFDARVVSGTHLVFAINYQSILDHIKVMVWSENGINGVSFRRADGTLIAGASNYGVDVSQWHRYTVNYHNNQLRLLIDDDPFYGHGGSSGLPTQGRVAIFSPLSTSCQATLRVDDVVVEKPMPYGTLGLGGVGSPPLGTSRDVHVRTYWADEARLDPVPGTNVPTFTTVVPITFDQPMTLLLTTTNDQGSTVDSLVVTPAPPIIEQFDVPATVIAGDTIPLTWSVSAGDSVRIEPIGFQSTDLSGTTFDAPLQSTSYTLELYHGGALVRTQSRGVTTELPQILSFSASPTTILPGESATLSWNVSVGQSIQIDPGAFVSTDLSGSLVVSPPDTTEYTLNLHYNIHDLQAQTTIAVEPSRIRSFEADPPVILLGDSSTLRWDISFGDSLRIEPLGFAPQAPQGELAVTPQDDATYTLSLYEAGNVTQQQVTVTVHDIQVTQMTVSRSLVPVASPVELRWSVAPSQATVTVGGQGPFLSNASTVLHPLTSTDFVLRAAIDGVFVEETRSVVVFDPAPASENIHVVRDLTTLASVVDAVESGIPFDVYVVAIQPPFAVAGFAFRMEFPPCVALLETEYPPFAAPLAAGPDYVVLLSPCQAPGDAVMLARFRLLPFANCVDEIHTLTPSAPTAAGAEFGLLECLAETWSPFDYVQGLSFGNGAQPSAVDANEPAQKSLRILATNPNPFNPRVVVHYAPVAAGELTIDVYDVTGRKVRGRRVVADSTTPRTWTWDGTDDRGRRVASGIYHVVLEQGGNRAVRKVALLK